VSYIGKEPQIGAYNMLDSLTASATASYSLTLDSVAFVPESANHLIVSLNGVIQKAGSSFTVSGSTLTFSSALTSSDSIDFVLALGNVLDIGTPSDATVTNAKTNFVSTSSAAGLQIKGDNTTGGTLQLNCEQNSHGIKLRSPAHSAGQSYTLTFPTGNVTADKFLKVASVSGSGATGIGQLSFADGGGNAPAFQAYQGSDSSNYTMGTATKVEFNIEEWDVGGCYNNTSATATLNGISTPAYAFAPNTAGKYFVYATARLDSSSNFPHDAYFYIYKNGSAYKQFQRTGAGSDFSGNLMLSGAVDLNGTSDYIQIYLILYNGVNVFLDGGADKTSAGAFLLGGTS